MYFFATTNDIQPIIQAIEQDRNLDYYEAGLFDSQVPVLYNSLVSTPTFDQPAAKATVQCRRYIVLSSPSSLQIRTVPQRMGGFKYAVDQLANPESLAIQLGGIYQDGIIVSSSIGTALNSKFATNLIASYRRRFGKEFRKTASGIYIGSEAEKLLRQGWRLVGDANQPKEYDLQKEAAHM
ncbi:hypothetical protein MUN84_05550 [Hymenobacter sp. 5516J-16]|uniref:hypothetical protein n=1 Tax=Hymenobacter sp. 5516J-16 TaxID=2932253 RepID=UPI001FD3D9F0|nr:hypothetical protein [Hymenobacter sp. 5516J-16]UOQ78076.1 hypothetical protein MUN84_05550 [Hymenobacter sp. 5516J-16]